MAKHTQTVRWQIADEMSVFDHFVKSALKGLMMDENAIDVDGDSLEILLKIF